MGSIVRRAGAKPGDVVFVSGTIGDAALGLAYPARHARRDAGGKSADHLLDRYLHPQPRVELAPVIRRFATASLDVSDGLVGDFAHICKQSGVGGEIDAASVPLSAGAKALVAADPSAFATVLTGGDDYEILATVRRGRRGRLRRGGGRGRRAGDADRAGRRGQGPPVVHGARRADPARPFQPYAFLTGWSWRSPGATGRAATW